MRSIPCRLLEFGFVPIGPLADGKDAWKAAQATVNDANAEPPLAVIGDFMIPPSDGPPSRDFQTLHLDFGIPLVPVAATDVARFTAVYVAADAPPSQTLTRLVPRCTGGSPPVGRPR